MTPMSPPSEYHDPFDATWRERLVVLGGVVVAVLIGLFLGLQYKPEKILELLGLLPVTFVAVGKFLPLWAVTGQSHFSAWQLGAVVWLLDTFTVLLIVYALEGFYRFEALKRALDRIQKNARIVLKAYPRIRRAAVVGIVLFVLFPVAGTGAIGATFLGILLGLHRFVLITAVSLGGLLGGSLMAFLASHFATILVDWRQSHSAKYIALAIVVVVIVLAVTWMNRAHRRVIQRVNDAATTTTPSPPANE